MEEKKLKNMSKKNQENFLEIKPKRASNIRWSVRDEIVTLEIENKGLFNRLAQKFLKKPQVSFIHLDVMGSFIWQLSDGKLSIIEIGKLVQERFGEKANPLYERLSKYISILQSYGFLEEQKASAIW